RRALPVGLVRPGGLELAWHDLWRPAFRNGAGPRVGETGLGLPRPCLFGAVRGPHQCRELPTVQSTLTDLSNAPLADRSKADALLSSPGHSEKFTIDRALLCMACSAPSACRRELPVALAEAGQAHA